jgi:hypothetical protein
MVVFKLCYFPNIFSTYVILPRFLSNCIISQKNNLRNQQQILLTLLLMLSINYYLQSKTRGLTQSAHTTLFTLSYFTIDILFKFLFYFSIWSLIFFARFHPFLSNSRTIESDLLEKKQKQNIGDQNRKFAINGWWFKSSHKMFTLVLELCNLYIFSPSIFFQFW